MSTTSHAVMTIVKIAPGSSVYAYNSYRGLWNKKEEVSSSAFSNLKVREIANVTLVVHPDDSLQVIKIVRHSDKAQLWTSRDEEKVFVERSLSLPETDDEFDERVRKALGVEKDDLREPYPTSIEVTAVEEVIHGADAFVKTIAKGLERNTEMAQRKKKLQENIQETDGYYISHDARLTFTTAKAMSDRNPERAVKLMMMGPSGYGKTTLPALFAERTGMRYLRMNCAGIRDPEEWFGYREAVEGSTVFVRSEFIKAAEEGNVVLVLDEFNRLEPWLHNTLFPLLDHDGKTVVHGEEFRLGPNVIVVGTINTGYRYTGTFELDEALLNRFELTLEVGPMPASAEELVLVKRTGCDPKVAKEIVKGAQVLRSSGVVCSTRTTLLMANMVVAGMTLREAFESAVVRRTPVGEGGIGQRKQVLDLINNKVGVLEVRKLDNDIFGGDVTVESEEVGDSEDDYQLLNLRLTGRGKFLRVQVIQMLRSLPVKGVEERGMSLKEGQKMAELLESGNEVAIWVNTPLDTIENITTKFKALGISVVISDSTTIGE